MEQTCPTKWCNILELTMRPNVSPRYDMDDVAAQYIAGLVQLRGVGAQNVLAKTSSNRATGKFIIDTMFFRAK